MAAEQTPFSYQFQRYCDAESAAQAAFGKQAKVIEPIRPVQSYWEPGLTVEGWTREACEKLSVSYDHFAYAAVTQVARRTIKREPQVLSHDHAEIRIPLSPVVTTEGDLPANILIHDLGMYVSRYGHEDFHLRGADRERPDLPLNFYPDQFKISTEIGDSDNPVDLNLLWPGRRHTAAQYHIKNCHPRRTGFTVPGHEDIDLPARGDRVNSEATWYAYAAGLAHVALKHLEEKGIDGVEVNPGRTRTLNDLRRRWLAYA